MIRWQIIFVRTIARFDFNFKSWQFADWLFRNKKDFEVHAKKVLLIQWKQWFRCFFKHEKTDKKLLRNLRCMQAQQNIKTQIIRKIANAVYFWVQMIRSDDELCHESFNQSKLKWNRIWFNLDDDRSIDKDDSLHINHQNY